MFALLLLFACGNPCQQACVEMANFAEEECGMEVTEDHLEQCAQKYETVDDARAQQCAEVGSRQEIEEWWTCEDLADNYAQGAASSR